MTKIIKEPGLEEVRASPLNTLAFEHALSKTKTVYKHPANRKNRNCKNMDVYIYIYGNTPSFCLEFILVPLPCWMTKNRSSMRAASWLLLQMNQQNRFLIPARQRKRALERQGLEALTANVSIHQDWEHWWVLAQESQPNAALVPPPPRREGLWSCACGVLSQFIKTRERGCKHPNEGAGCH